MKPLVTFPDAQAAGVRILRAALATRPEPYAAGVVVGARVPGTRSDDLPGLPYVMVRLDADVTRYPVNARVTLRVTVWHRTPEDAIDLAQLCRGLLAVSHGYGIRNVLTDGQPGPVASVDPDSGVDLATFMVAANVRPEPI